MTRTAAQPRRMRADAARNRQALMDAAHRLFTTRGLSVTLDDIAAEAGVNVATAYRHFSNKHELAGAFIQQITDEAIAIVEQAAAADDPWRGLTDFFTRTVRLMADNRGLHDVVTASYTTEWMHRLEEQVNPPLRRLLSRGQRAGKIRSGVGPEDLGVLLQMLATVTDIDAGDVDALLTRYLAVILDGLKPSPSRLPGRPPTTGAVQAAARRAVTRP